MKFQERLSIYIGTADQQSIKQDTKTSAQKLKQSQWVSQCLTRMILLIDQAYVIEREALIHLKNS